MRPRRIFAPVRNIAAIAGEVNPEVWVTQVATTDDESGLLNSLARKTAIWREHGIHGFRAEPICQLLPVRWTGNRATAGVVDQDRSVAGYHIVRVALLRWLRRCHRFDLGGDLDFRSTARRRFIVYGWFWQQS